MRSGSKTLKRAHFSARPDTTLNLLNPPPLTVWGLFLFRVATVGGGGGEGGGYIFKAGPKLKWRVYYLDFRVSCYLRGAVGLRGV